MAVSKKAAVIGENSEQQLFVCTSDSAKKIVQEMGLEPTRS